MKNQNTMLHGPLFSGIVKYTIPIILTSLLQLAFNAADLIVVGRYCGSISLAAVGATSSLTSLMVNFFIGLSVGTAVTVAQGLGARQAEAVHRVVHTAIPTALISGLVLTVLGVSCSSSFLRMMGTPEAVLPLSSLYMKIYFSGITFTLLYNFCASILRAAGDTKSPLVFLSIAGVSNVVMNVIFVTAFDMNVAGVALATTLSQGISAVLVVMALMRRQDACKLMLSRIRIYGCQLKEILRIGMPAGIQSCLFAVSNVVVQSSVNSFGDVFMSGNAAAANVDGFVYVCLNGFHQTAMNYIGQNAGARQYRRVNQILWTCMGCSAVVGLTLGTLVYTFGPELLSIYITDSQLAVDYGMIRLKIICLTYFLGSLLDVSTGTLRGLGESFTPMLISVLGVCGIRIGWMYTIFRVPRFHTPESLYMSYPIS